MKPARPIRQLRSRVTIDLVLAALVYLLRPVPLQSAVA
jgi:hypothetical protein